MGQFRCINPMSAKVILLTWGACCLLCSSPVMADDKPVSLPEKPQTYQGIIAARAAPDLTTLVRRSSPETQGQDATESFWDLLKLRETADAKAVSVLEKILVENGPTTRIHGFAAAQALFCIGTAESHQILARYKFAEACLALDYTSHWEMKEPLRSRYIERYLLKNLSKSLVVEVEQAPSATQPKDRLNLVVIVRNTSDEPFHILDHEFPGDLLYLRDATGQHSPRIHDKTMCGSALKYVELTPGKTHRFNVAIELAAAGSKRRPPQATGEIVADVREAGHSFDINSPGRFEVLALFEARPLTDEGRMLLKVDQDWKWWSGRAVSKPLKIEIGLPGSAGREK